MGWLAFLRRREAHRGARTDYYTSDLDFHDGEICLDGNFTADQLVQLAALMIEYREAVAAQGAKEPAP